MLKVIQFITSMGEGGAQSLVKDYALNLDEDFDVLILCVFPLLDSSAGREIIRYNIPIKSVYPNYTVFWRLVNKLAGNYIVRRVVKKTIKKYQPDVIHAHLGVLQYLAPIKNHLPKVIYTCHSEPQRTFGTARSSEFKAAKDLLIHADMQIVALHRQMKEEIDGMFGINNTIVIYNGIDIKHFETINENQNEIRDSLGINPDVFLIGHVGRFIVEKNHLFLIRVFAQLKEIRPESKLLLVGTGPLKEKVENLIVNLRLSEDVILLGHRNDVERLLKAMDVFLLPSIKEGFPISLIEAQVAGLHCVVSKNITDEAFISPKLTSLDLLSPIEEWVKAIIDIKGKDAVSVKTELFDIKNSIKGIEQLYRQ